MSLWKSIVGRPSSSIAKSVVSSGVAPSIVASVVLVLGVRLEPSTRGMTRPGTVTTHDENSSKGQPPAECVGSSRGPSHASFLPQADFRVSLAQVAFDPKHETVWRIRQREGARSHCCLHLFNKVNESNGRVRA